MQFQTFKDAWINCWVTAECMNLTGCVTKPPWSSQQEIVNGFRNERQHQHEIGDGQIDNQHIRWSAQRRKVAEDLQHNVVSTESKHTFTKISPLHLKSCQNRFKSIEFSCWSNLWAIHWYLILDVVMALVVGSDQILTLIYTSKTKSPVIKCWSTWDLF